MADDDQAAQGAQAGEGSENNADGANGADGQGKGTAIVKGGGPDDPINPRRLKAVLEKRDKDLEAKIAESTAPILDSHKMLQESIEALSKRFEEQAKAADDDKDKAKGKDTKEKVELAEVMSLRDKLQDLQDQLTKEREKRQQAETLRSEEAFERKVKDALVDAGVMPTRLDRVYRAVKDDFDREAYKKDGTIQAPYEDEELGENFLPLKDYVRQVIKMKDMPECFAGGTRTGADAGGEAFGPDGRKYKFTQKQLRDTAFYAENRDAIRKALDAGEVEPPEGKEAIGVKAYGSRR